MDFISNVAELADALDSGSSVHYGRGGSNPLTRMDLRIRNANENAMCLQRERIFQWKMILHSVS